MSDLDIVNDYATRGWRFITWPQQGDVKGPQTKDWTSKTYTVSDYKVGRDRVGLITGVQIAPGRYLHDVDIDWAPGAAIALYFIPQTDFIFGRQSKPVSHCFYTLPEALPSLKYEDIDKTTLIEIRGVKNSGEPGFQTMVPPSVWSKGDQKEPLIFQRYGLPAHVPTSGHLKEKVCLAAIGMILAKHLGHNGFGHDTRMAWAGYLLRAGVTVEDMVMMGVAMSLHCNNREVEDVRRVVESTAQALAIETKKVKGGPTLARILGQNGKAIIAVINKWLGRDVDFIRSDEGVIIRDHQDNIARAMIMLNHELAYDEFSERALIDKKFSLDDAQLDGLWLKIDEEFKFRPTYVFFEKVIKKLCRDSCFHPVREYLDGLGWDGVSRLDTWLIDYAGAVDTPYVRAVSSIPLIAAVRRIRHPGVKYDELLILEGEQGLNKSSALRALCPRAEWFSDDLPLNISSQRVIEGTLGKWIIEAADLAGKRKAEVEQLKAMLSRGTDGPARMAYAHLPVERARQFILIGTTNSAAYLTDPTGARRFWPVAIHRFDVPKLTLLRDQLWAEAAAREAANESIRLAEELWPDATSEQERRREMDPWEVIIRDALVAIIPSQKDNKRRVATTTLWEALAIETPKRDRGGASRIADIMQRLGFKRTTVRLDSGVTVGYISERPEALNDPIAEDDVAVVTPKRTAPEF